MLFLNMFTILVTLVFMFYLYYKWTYTFWSRRGVFQTSCNFPLGNLNDVAFGRVTFQEMFKKLYAELKPKGMKYFGYYLLQQPVLVVLDLQLIKSIMVKDFAYFTDRGILVKKDYDFMSGNVCCLQGAEWKNLREKLTPFFTSSKLKMMFPIAKHCSVQLENLIDQAAESSEKLDIKDIAGRYTTDIIASIAFGLEINSIKNSTSDFQKYAERVFGQADTDGKLRMLLIFIMPSLATFLKVNLIAADISDFFLNIIKSTIKYREENNIIRKDFVQLMIQLKNNIDVSDNNNDCFRLKTNNKIGNAENKENVDSLSIEEISSQIIVFFMAGYDTSSTTITLCMYELAFHLDIQEKLRDEITNVLNEHEGKLSYDAIMKMTYMDKCIKETLRKYPLLSNLFRQCTKSYQVPNSDFIIEKDMIVLIPVNELHYDPEYYPNPEKFDPERFSNKRSPLIWLPFGEGPRSCIGTRLAMIAMKVALLTLIKNFRYSLDSRTAYPLKRASRTVFISSEEKILLNVEKIN